MTRSLFILFPLAVALVAQAAPREMRKIAFKEAVREAMMLDPSVQLALLGVERSRSDLALNRAAGHTQLGAGSGLGATAGIPQSIQGAAPSVAQVTLRQPLVDISRKRHADVVRAVREAGEHGARAAAEESGYRAGLLYLDLELAEREAGRTRADLGPLERIRRETSLRVREGLEMPLALSQAQLELTRASGRSAAASDRVKLLEADLRRVLGLGPGVRVVTSGDDTVERLRDAWAAVAPLPHDQRPEMASLAAELQAARHRAREARAGRLPRVDLLGQYSLLARFNNYDDYFRRFQRHNWQAGLSLEVPILSGRRTAERVARARLDEREVAIRATAVEGELAMRDMRARAELKSAQRAAELAGMELEVARERLNVALARFGAGEISLGDLDRERVLESAAWGGLIASRYGVARAQLCAVYASGAMMEAFGD